MEALYKVYPILEKVNRSSNGIVDRMIVKKEMYPKESLKRYGDSCIGFTFLVEGEIKINKINKDGKETYLYNLKPGELCHEALSCILECRPLNINADATKKCIVYILPLEIVEKYLLKDIEFMKYLYKNLYKKTKLLIESKEKITHEPLEERLIELLKDRNSKIIYATHEELAVELGSSREVITRKLKKLEREGILKTERGKIYLTVHS